MPQQKFPLDPRPKIITFDCYGTLVQWYEVLLQEIDVLLRAHDVGGKSASSILESFSAQGRALTAEKPQWLYKDVLRIGFANAFQEHGVQLSDEEIQHVPKSPMAMGPHPEVPDALLRLKENYKLAIFTNSDNDLIAPTVKSIGVRFDYVITAEQADSYKPSREMFEYAYRQVGVGPEETVHVAMGMYWEMKARHELGLRGIWVNRRGQKGNPDWLPYAEVSDLDGAADLLLPEVHGTRV